MRFLELVDIMFGLPRFRKEWAKGEVSHALAIELTPYVFLILATYADPKSEAALLLAAAAAQTLKMLTGLAEARGI